MKAADPGVYKNVRRRRVETLGHHSFSLSLEFLQVTETLAPAESFAIDRDHPKHLRELPELRLDA
jgi:hypothetical protein